MANDKQVDAYIEGLDGDAKRLATDLRAMIFAAAPEADESFKWSRPCYALQKQFCSFVVNKAHIGLSFDQGASLEDPDGLLEGTGKAMRHVKIPLDARKIPAGVKALLKRAAAVDRHPQAGPPAPGRHRKSLRRPDPAPTARP